MTYYVQFWVNSDNANGGYWDKREFASMYDAKRFVLQVAGNWSIRPEYYIDRATNVRRLNPVDTTWKIAKVDCKRVGASELWQLFDIAMVSPQAVAIVSACIAHSVPWMVLNGRLQIQEHGTHNDEAYTTDIDATDWTLSQLYAWLGY